MVIGYGSYPIAVTYFVRKRKDLEYRWLYLAFFNGFILTCTSTHLMKIVTIWLPVYWLSAYVSAISGVVALSTVFALWWVIPRALRLPSPAELQRQRSATQYVRSLIEASLDPLVTITTDGFLTDANAAFLAMTGLTREQVVGSYYANLVTPVETAKAGFAKAVTEGQVRDVPLELKHVDGHATAVLYNANIFRDENGKVAGVLAVARDISSLKRAEAEVARLNRWNKLVLDSTGEGIYGIDTEGRCTFTNPAMTRLLGYESPDELLGKNAHALFHHSRPDGTPYPIEECPAHRAYREGEVYRAADEVYWCKGGGSLPVEYVSTPIREDGRLVGAVVTVRDITERKRAEELLQLRAREQEGIAHLGLRALTGESLDALMSDATRLVAESLEVELCNVLELLPGGQEAVLRAGVGWKDGYVGTAKVSTGPDSQTGYALERGEPVVVKDLHRETRFSIPLLLHEHGVVSGMSVVIPGREGPFGVMGAHTTREREFSRDDVNFLQAVANVIAASVERAHAEERLRAAGAYNRRLIEVSLDPLVTIGPDGTINDVNAATEGVTGRPRGELINTDFSNYFVDPARARTGYEKMFREGFVRDYPLEIRHADGHVTPVLYNATVYRDEQGRVAGVFAAARDITERKRAEEALRASEFRYRSLFERMFDGYAVHEIVLDAEGRPCDYVFLEVNPAFERMTGLRRDQILGKRVREVLPDVEPIWIEKYGEVALTGQGQRFEQFAAAFDRHFEVAAFSPAPRQFATLFSDVTERRLAEQALRDLNRELEQRVQERTASLEAANRELESFSYSVSHDLRAPLRAIDGFSKILLTDYEERLDDEGKRLLRVVRENTEKMSQLIADILNFSRTGRAELRREKIDMGRLARDVWEQVRQAEPERRFDFRLADLPPADGDRALLRQVFVNLLSNAVKFTRGRPEAVIEVEARAGDRETIYVVKDNGVGFDVKYADRLFGVFQRLHSAEQFEGTGVGLAIVKLIVSRHGGRVWAESRLGEGATFYIALPKAEAGG